MLVKLNYSQTWWSETQAKINTSIECHVIHSVLVLLLILSTWLFLSTLFETLPSESANWRLHPWVLLCCVILLSFCTQKQGSKPSPVIGLNQERTTKALEKTMRMNVNMNDDYGKQDNRMHMNSLQPGGDKILKLRPENNKPGGGSMPPLNLTENITAQDRALSEQVSLSNQLYRRLIGWIGKPLARAYYCYNLTDK